MDSQRFESANCMEGFKEMINSEKEVKKVRNKRNQHRVYLPVLNDENPSHFLMLDPIGWPIDYIEVNFVLFRKKFKLRKRSSKRLRSQPGDIGNRCRFYNKLVCEDYHRFRRKGRKLL